MTTLTLKRGDTWRTTFAWTQPDGTPVDLSGCTALMQVRNKITDELALDLSTVSGELVVSGLTGEVAVDVSAELMRTVAPGSYLTDLELTFADGTVMSTDTTIVKVLRDISHG